MFLLAILRISSYYPKEMCLKAPGEKKYLTAGMQVKCLFSHAIRHGSLNGLFFLHPKGFFFFLKINSKKETGDCFLTQISHLAV